MLSCCAEGGLVESIGRTVCSCTKQEASPFSPV
uniref:Uncharacterized protein n=1 Tax=Arundo donax TaxID=35708 RepID=A0A0A8Z1Z5_ARUDO